MSKLVLISISISIFFGASAAPLAARQNNFQCVAACGEVYRRSILRCDSSTSCGDAEPFCLSACSADAGVTYGSCVSGCNEAQRRRPTGRFVGTYSYAPGSILPLTAGRWVGNGFAEGQGTVTQVSFHMLDLDAIAPDAFALAPSHAMSWVALGQGAFDGHQFWSLEVDMGAHPSKRGFVLRADFEDGGSTQSGVAVASLQQAVATEHDPLEYGIRFSGGLSVDGLTEQSFFLNPIAEQGFEGFHVQRNRSAENTYTPGISLMAHLLRERRNQPANLNWSPVTLGIAIGDQMSTRLLLGTSLEVGQLIFLTGGVALGRVSRLPADLRVGDVTQDRKALIDLPKRYRTSWFAGLSYRFGV